MGIWLVLIIFLIILVVLKILLMKQNKTLVMGFFDIGRSKWPSFQRSLEQYLQNGKRNMSLNESMVIFIEPKFLDFVKESRKKFAKKTLVIPIRLEDLPKYKLLPKIKQIMDSRQFKQGIKDPTVPEMWNPSYVLVMWSKTDLLHKAIKMNPFGSTHFAWLDFGMPDFSQLNAFPTKFSPKVKFLCRTEPQKEDLDRVKMCKSQTNRFAGGFFSGRYDYLLDLVKRFDHETNICLSLNVVDSDQTIFSNVYLQAKHIFELYTGDWGQIFTNYNQGKKVSPSSVSVLLHFG